MISLAIAAIGLVTHFFHFGRPASVVFDEVFYGNFLSYYWHGTYFFDQHPPFFKLFMSVVGYMTGASNYSADWSSIGNFLPDAIIYLRAVPAAAGVLLPIVIYLICRRFDISKTASFLAATLLCLENSLIVQSRFILPDVVMLLAGFSAILFYLEYVRQSSGPSASLPARPPLARYSFWLMAASTILAAAALSIKWTGATFLFMIIVMEIFRRQPWKKTTLFTLKYSLVAAALYIALFAVHFAALPSSGTGDVFMSREFQKTLTGNSNAADQNITAKGFAEKFSELNYVMYETNHRMTATHPYSSEWYTWPIMKRSIFYWQGTAASSAGGQVNSYIYLLGNPFVYWLGTLSMIVLILSSVFWMIRKRMPQRAAWFLIIGYLVNLLPFAFIGRVMFLYHYETALIFSIMAIAFLTDLLSDKKKLAATATLIAIALAAFIYWAPLTYGTPITDEQLQDRMWLTTWR